VEIRDNPKQVGKKKRIKKNRRKVNVDLLSVKGKKQRLHYARNFKSIAKLQSERELRVKPRVPKT